MPNIYNKTIREGDVIAVGDVHATWDLYLQFLLWVKGSGARVILLGDLIDRGGDDLAVLGATATLLESPESWGLESFSVIRGNHEQMFIDAAAGRPKDLDLWLYNGGNEHQFDQMVERHLDWIKELPYFITIGDTIFVHAGVEPGKSPRMSIANGTADQLIWIRKPFLNNGPMLQLWNRSLKKVVHGHSITFMSEGGSEDNPEPVVKKDRVNLDTGAFLSNGRLTAYNVTQNTFHQFPHQRGEDLGK